MTTRALVPNADGEGSLGVENLKWGAVYVSSPDKEDNSQKVPSTAWVQSIMAEARQSIMAEVYGGLSGTVLPTTAHVGQSFTLDRGDVSDGYERFVKYVCTAVNGGVPTWTTEFLLDPAHAVSTVLWTGTIAINPGTVYGGKWEPMPAGYTLISQGKGSDQFGSFEYVAGQKYGERKHQLTTDELPIFTTTSHFHTGFNAFCIGNLWNGNGASNTWKNSWNVQSGSTSGYAFNQTIDMDLVSNPVGGDVAHNNLQPSVGAYGWRRTA